MEKIYKYTSIKSAIEILKDNSVLLSKPYEFNDPFDSAIDFDEKDVEKSISIVGNYYVIKYFLDNFKRDILFSTLFERIVFIYLSIRIKLLYKKFKRKKYYGNVPFSGKIVNYIMKKTSKNNFKKFEELKKQKQDSLVWKIKMIGMESLISCFSVESKSILMWSHYADKHRGVCIEFERPSAEFFDNIYSKNRCIFNLEETTRIVLAYLILNNKGKIEDEKLNKLVFEPFLTKSRSWRYEKEVRCVFNKETAGVFQKVINDNEKKQKVKKDFYKMPTKITKVFFGCKVDIKSEEYKELIKLIDDKEIKKVFLKTSEKKFALEEMTSY